MQNKHFPLSYFILPSYCYCKHYLQKRGRARRTEPAVHVHVAVARARVHVNGKNVIALINRDTFSVLCGRRRGISA